MSYKIKYFYNVKRVLFNEMRVKQVILVTAEWINNIPLQLLLCADDKKNPYKN